MYVWRNPWWVVTCRVVCWPARVRRARVPTTSRRPVAHNTAHPCLRYCPTMREMLWQTMTAARPAWHRRPPAIYDILLRDLMTLNVSPLCLRRPSPRSSGYASDAPNKLNVKRTRTEPWTEYAYSEKGDWKITISRCVNSCRQSSRCQPTVSVRTRSAKYLRERHKFSGAPRVLPG